MNYKIKLIVGFRRDQEHTVDMDEAHKAYYLFLNPDSRGIFKNGLAIIGSEIRDIVPDYNATMGWNPAHTMDTDDWNQVRAAGADRKMQGLLAAAREVAQLGKPEDLNTPLQELMAGRYAKKEIGVVSAVKKLAAEKRV